MARALVDTANGAGLPTRALITDMNQVLGRFAGNAVEVAECIEVLCGETGEPRLMEITRRLAAQTLMAGGIAGSVEAADVLIGQALDSGAAAGIGVLIVLCLMAYGLMKVLHIRDKRPADAEIKPRKKKAQKKPPSHMLDTRRGPKDGNW